MPSQFHESLRQLKRLVRVGLPLSDSADLSNDDELKNRIQQILRTLKSHGIEKAEPADQLQYRTLNAEFEYNFGLGSAAVIALNDYLASSVFADSRGRGLVIQLHIWHETTVRPRFQLDGDPNVLRQKIWALMAVAFYKDYLGGNSEQARQALTAIQHLIEIELRRPAHEPYGSLSRVHYFLGQCCRNQGDFWRATAHFQEAQSLAADRLARELRAVAKETNEVQRNAKRQYEQQFSVICTARVLASLSRVDMLQGRLSQSLRNLYAAKTLLAGGQLALRKVVDTHIAIAKRRLIRPGDNGWKEILSELEKSYTIFAPQGSIADFDGARRCSQELIKAYLDEAELVPAKRPNSLSKADAWIKKMEILVRECGGEKSLDLLSVHVFRAWRFLLDDPPDLASADDELGAAEEMEVGERYDQHHLDHAGVDRVDIRLAKGVYRDLAASIKDDPGESASSYFKKLRRDARHSNDPLLEAECVLRLARAEILEKKPSEAQIHLQEWQLLAPYVENASLHMLYRKILGSCSQFEHAFPEHDLYFDEQVDLVRFGLVEWAVARYGSDAATHLNVKKERIRDILAEKKKKEGQRRANQH